MDSQFHAAAQEFQSGNFERAEQLCRDLLTREHEHADAWHLLGMIAGQAGRREEAVQLLRRAAVIRPRDAALANNLGEMLRLQNELGEAVAAFQTAIRLAAGFPEPHYNLGIALKALERRDEAMESFGRAIELRPDYARAHYNLANLLREEGRVKAAVAHYLRALEKEPAWADAHLNLGTAYYELGELDSALDQLQTAQRLDPSNADIDVTIGHIHMAGGDVRRAADQYRRKLARQPGWSLANLKVELLAEVIPPDAQSIETYLAHVSDVLDRQLDRPLEILPETLQGSGAEPPMALAYQGRDVRPIIERFAALYAPGIEPLKPKRNCAKPRVGIVVTHGHEGVFARCWGGIAQRLSRALLEVRLVCSRSGANVLRQMMGLDARECLILPERVDEAARTLGDAAFDLLHYWEIGTDSTNYFLPFFQPAPLQSTTGGWPVTSGNPRVNYFISCRGLEPDGAQSHYRESLVLLERLPMYYERPAMPERLKSREQFGMGEHEHVYLCAQNLRKYHPEFDRLLAEILRRDPRGRLYIIADSQLGVTRRLLERFGRSLGDVADRVRVLGRMQRSDYLNAVALADVALDTLPYGGGVNTVYDTL
ncbi:MAG TPA: tetratricopeptide repeat protein, partial [Pirellulales bacterium]|nr:tetratricopeptide repeat protein [Pirellulales bacterium]